MGENVSKECEICAGDEWDLVYMGPVRDGAWCQLNDRSILNAARMCKGCGVIRLDRSMGATEYQTEEYRKKLEEPVDAKGFFETHDSEQVFKLMRVNDLPIRGKKVLDVGAGPGAFLDYLRGVCAEISAVEPCRIYEEELFRKCKDVFNYVQSVPPSFKYDLITCFDTVEHVQDPLRLIQAAYKLLAPAGTLVVSTGEYEAMKAYAEPQSYFRTQHKWYWNQSAFESFYRWLMLVVGETHRPKSSLMTINEPQGPQMYLRITKPITMNG
jgi:2-polyprenyl-3-methyl-5-hydroxy-6-metoxy-1,4-benzoquinol methylase